MKTKLLIILNLTLSIYAYAGSATWNLNPASNDWNTATNWTPATVPDATTDVATFGASNTTSVLTSANVDLASLVFDAGAPSYSIVVERGRDLTFWGEGPRNDSGLAQTFTGGSYTFNESSSAGTNVSYGPPSGGCCTGSLTFNDNASAESASFTNTGIDFFDNASADHGVFTRASVDFHNNSTAANGVFTAGNGAEINFFDNSTAETAQFTVSGAGLNINFSGNSTAADASFLIDEGQVTFEGFDFNRTKSTAANGLFIITGGSASGDLVGHILFNGGTGGNATLVANSGTNGGDGGTITFFQDDASEARIELLGNGTLSVAVGSLGNGEVTVGSVEGDGLVVIADQEKIIIGSNNLDTTFSGLVQNGTGAGAIAKIGTGTLTLTGANTYTGGTTISSGVLLVSNGAGSGTGTGAVSVNAGTLGGSGIIAGAVTVGTNTGVQAFLAPSKGVKKPATFTIQGALTFNDDSTYIYKLDTKRVKADEVIANGVVIDGGAKFSFRPSGNNTLPFGQVFIVIDNTAATPIVGTFHNLADGAIVTINSNNLQASYSGGDGNDLILTVVP